MRTSWLLLCLMACSSAEPDGREDDAEAVPCEPETCWEQVYANLDCLLNPRSTQSRDCQRLNATEMCKVFEDALRCSAEMGDSGCAFKFGRENFDFWTRGLEAINTKMCFESLMANILTYAQCWDILRFANCVQHFVGELRHVVDLAGLPAAHGHGAHGAQGAADAGGWPQREQCHLVMLRISKCAGLAARQDPADQGPTFCSRAPVVDHVNEILAAYFSASECGGVGVGAVGDCPAPAPPQPEATTPPARTPASAAAPAAQGHDILGVPAPSPAPARPPADCTSAAAPGPTAPAAFAALAAVISVAAINSA